jgi:hypothetical protein
VFSSVGAIFEPALRTSSLCWASSRGVPIADKGSGLPTTGFLFLECQSKATCQRDRGTGRDSPDRCPRPRGIEEIDLKLCFRPSTAIPRPDLIFRQVRLQTTRAAREIFSQPGESHWLNSNSKLARLMISTLSRSFALACFESLVRWCERWKRSDPVPAGNGAHPPTGFSRCACLGFSGPGAQS